jgi:hypothetical protein
MISGEHDLAQALDLAQSYSIDILLAAGCTGLLANGLTVPHRERQ